MPGPVIKIDISNLEISDTVQKKCFIGCNEKKTEILSFDLNSKTYII